MIKHEHSWTEIPRFKCDMLADKTFSCQCGAIKTLLSTRYADRGFFASGYQEPLPQGGCSFHYIDEWVNDAGEVVVGYQKGLTSN